MQKASLEQLLSDCASYELPFAPALLSHSKLLNPLGGSTDFFLTGSDGQVHVYRSSPLDLEEYRQKRPCILTPISRVLQTDRPLIFKELPQSSIQVHRHPSNSGETRCEWEEATFENSYPLPHLVHRPVQDCILSLDIRKCQDTGHVIVATGSSAGELTLATYDASTKQNKLLTKDLGGLNHGKSVATISTGNDDDEKKRMQNTTCYTTFIDGPISCCSVLLGENKASGKPSESQVRIPRSFPASGTLDVAASRLQQQQGEEDSKTVVNEKLRALADRAQRAFYSRENRKQRRGSSLSSVEGPPDSKTHSQRMREEMKTQLRALKGQIDREILGGNTQTTMTRVSEKGGDMQSSFGATSGMEGPMTNGVGETAGRKEEEEKLIITDDWALLGEGGSSSSSDNSSVVSRSSGEEAGGGAGGEEKEEEEALREPKKENEERALEFGWGSSDEEEEVMEGREKTKGGREALERVGGEKDVHRKVLRARERGKRKQQPIEGEAVEVVLDEESMYISDTACATPPLRATWKEENRKPKRTVFGVFSASAIGCAHVFRDVGRGGGDETNRRDAGRGARGYREGGRSEYFGGGASYSSSDSSSSHVLFSCEEKQSEDSGPSSSVFVSSEDEEHIEEEHVGKGEGAKKRETKTTITKAKVEGKTAAQTALTPSSSFSRETRSGGDEEFEMFEMKPLHELRDLKKGKTESNENKQQTSLQHGDTAEERPFARAGEDKASGEEQENETTEGRSSLVGSTRRRNRRRQRRRNAEERRGSTDSRSPSPEFGSRRRRKESYYYHYETEKQDSELRAEFGHFQRRQMLEFSDHFDTITCNVLADVDLDGVDEHLLGTYGKQILMYGAHHEEEEATADDQLSRGENDTSFLEHRTSLSSFGPERTMRANARGHLTLQVKKKAC